MLATGLPASPGAAVGQIVFTADEAVVKAGTGKKKNPVILVRAETTPEDIHGMEVAAGILTSRGGMTLIPASVNALSRSRQLSHTPHASSSNW